MSNVECIKGKDTEGILNAKCNSAALKAEEANRLRLLVKGSREWYRLEKYTRMEVWKYTRFMQIAV